MQQTQKETRPLTLSAVDIASVSSIEIYIFPTTISNNRPTHASEAPVPSMVSQMGCGTERQTDTRPLLYAEDVASITTASERSLF